MPVSTNTCDSPKRPSLRNDLALYPGPVTAGGAPTWTLHDPVRHAFFRIGRREFEILLRWEKVDDEIIATLERETTFTITSNDIDMFHRFLAASNLLKPEDPAVRARLRQRMVAPKQNWLKQILLSYLFFRVPIAKPDRFLSKTLPYVRRLLPIVRFLFIPAFVLALYILIRQWSAFIHTFTYFFTFQGILFYSLAIFGAKLAHELGHAYAAKHFGISVPTMGVAFMVLWPILYTDNTDAWRVRSRRARMTIVASGIIVEIGIAVLATLLWAVLPDGPGRSACFILASATWIQSLAFNGMPFLRFDGYYFLSDFLNIPNLHNRSFAFGRWFLQKFLLGVDRPAPEKNNPGRQRFFILFAYTTWIYRLFLFTGIALMVYHLFFKALGLFLFAVEIVWFLGRPVWMELKSWPSLLGDTGWTRRNIIFLLAIVGLVTLTILPLSEPIHVPALLKPGTGNWVYPPVSAQIRAVHVKNGQTVQVQDKLFDMTSPDLSHNIRLTQSRVAMLTARIKRQVNDRQLREQNLVLRQQLAEAQTALSGYLQQQQQLSIYANTAGIIFDIPDGIRPGRWVNPGQQLAFVADCKKPRIEGFVPETLLNRIPSGTLCRFYPDDPERPVLEGSLDLIDRTAIRVLEEPYLASVYGGAVPVLPMNGNLAVQQSLYRVELTFSPEALPFPQVTCGKLRIRVKPQSLAVRAVRRLGALFVRESGF